MNNSDVAFVLSDLQAFKIGIAVGKALANNPSISIPKAIENMIAQDVMTNQRPDPDDEALFNITSTEIPTEAQILKFFYAKAQQIIAYYEKQSPPG